MKFFRRYQSSIQQIPEGVLQSAITMGGVIISMSVSAASMIIISRHLGPSLFGDFSLGFSLVVIFSQVGDMGVNFAMNKLISPAQAKKTQDTFFSAAVRIKFLANMVFVAIASLVLAVLWSQSKLTSANVVVGAIGLYGVTLVFDHVLYMLRSLHKFYRAIAMTLTQALLKVVLVVGLVALQIKSALVAFVLYSLAPAMPLFGLRWLFPEKRVLSLKRQDEKTRTVMLSLVRHTALLLIAQTVIDNADVVLVKYFLPNFEAGVYAGVSRIALLFTFSAHALGMVLNPRVSQYTNRNDIFSFLKKGWLLAGGAAVALIVLVPLQPLLVRYSIGSEYLPGILDLTLLNVSAFITLATIPFLAVFYSLKADWVFSFIGVTQLVLFVVSNVVLLPLFGSAGVAASKVLVRGATFALAVMIGYRLLNMKASSAQVAK